MCRMSHFLNERKGGVLEASVPHRWGVVRRQRRGPCTAVPCLAPAARTGMEAVPRPKWEGAGEVESISAAAAAGGAEAGQRGGLSERGRTSTRRADAPARTQSGCSESRVGSLQVPRLSAAPGTEAAPHTLVPSWRPELRRGRDGEAGAARGEGTIPRPSQQHPLTARL